MVHDGLRHGLHHRDWHLTYSNRKGVDDDDEGNLSNAPSGYLWDACAPELAELSQLRRIRQARQPPATATARWRRVPGLVGHMCPDFGVSKIKGKPCAIPTTPKSS